MKPFVRPPCTTTGSHLIAGKVHGTLTLYEWGCRCVFCTAAAVRYALEKERIEKEYRL